MQTWNHRVRPAHVAPRETGRFAPGAHHSGTEWSDIAARWWPLAVGIAAILGSTSLRFAHGIWRQPEYEHGSLLMLGGLWLLWNERAALLSAGPPASARWAGAFLLATLIAYVLGVRIKTAYLEYTAAIFAVLGALWMMGGIPLVRRLWFPLLFLFIAVPLPANVVVAATSGMKEWVSAAVESTLHIAGLPIGRDGVTLRIGPYSLLIADACSGMNSLISLTAVGLLYMYLTARRNLAQAVLLLLAILPIAITTNFIRVLILTLVTYYLGDEAGQGFLHEFAGFLMFLVAVAALASVDGVLLLFLKRKPVPANGAN